MSGEINLINAIPLHYRILAIGALAVATYGLGWLKGAHHAELKAAKFEAATEALGKAQLRQTKLINDRNLQLKQEADRAYAKSQSDLTALYADYRRLRNRPSGSAVPRTPTFAPSADRTCFKSTELADAIRGYEENILGILEQGDHAINALNIAKDWGKQ